MGLEIERKFLVRGESWRESVTHQVSIKQGYLTNEIRLVTRVRISGNQAFLTLKGATDGIRRSEFEYEIPLADAQAMLASLSDGSVIEKTRFFVPIENHMWEIDIFDGDNAGLIVAEIELRDEAENFVKPDWLGEEISTDARYFNANLIRHPYMNW